jgi:hypothetical protein
MCKGQEATGEEEPRYGVFVLQKTTETKRAIKLHSSSFRG